MSQKKSREVIQMKQLTPLTYSLIVFFLSFLLVLQTYISTPAFGQEIEIPSSANPVGSGARAIGMGGAFIGIADDATAASWNPGGLIQLEKPELSIVGTIFHRIEDNEFGTSPEASGRQSVTEEDLNYLSLAYPFSLFGRNMIVSLSYQNLFDFTRKWDFFLLNQSEIISSTSLFNYEQDGSLWAIGLAYCIQLTPALSFGFTLNFWEDFLYDNSWDQTIREIEIGTLNGAPFTSG
jgi:hypothetical protein